MFLIYGNRITRTKRKKKSRFRKCKRAKFEKIEKITVQIREKKPGPDPTFEKNWIRIKPSRKTGSGFDS